MPTHELLQFLDADRDRRPRGADDASEVEEDGGVDGGAAAAGRGEVAALEPAMVGLGAAAPQHPRLDRRHRVGPPLDLARLRHGLPPFARSGGVDDDGPLHHGRSIEV